MKDARRSPVRCLLRLLFGFFSSLWYTASHFHFPNLCMALLAKKTKGTCCSPACALMKWVVCVLLFVATVAAAVGTYQTHVLMGGETLRFQFGSTSGSLAIIAFTIATMAWVKQMVCCMSECEVCSK